MGNVILDDLPETVQAGSVEIPIYPDFRSWMDFSARLCSPAASKDDTLELLTLIMPVIPDVPADDLATGILAFLHNEPPKVETVSRPKLKRDEVKEQEEKEEADRRPRVIDYEHDADLIFSAFWQIYNLDLSKVDLHWHVFKALLNGLPDHCQMRKVMGYRSLGPKDFSSMGKEQAKHYRELQRDFALPDHRTQEEIDAEFAALL